MGFWSRRRCVLLLAGWLLSACALFGWSEKGHRIAAKAAQQQLSQKSKQRMAYLLGQDVELPDVATWADQIIQERPETEAWHSITIPPGARGIDFGRDCPLGECLTVKVRDCVGIVRLSIRPKAEIVDAFRMLVSLAADMHQPMLNGYPPSHARDDSIVVLDGVEMPLFNAWESGLIDRLGSEEEVLERVIEKIASADTWAWTQGTFKAWTWETHRIATDQVYPSISNPAGKTVLAADDLDKASEVIVEQLAKSAVRLAHILEIVWP